MFRQIHNHSIAVWIEHPNKVVLSIPSGDAYLVAQKLWRIQTWLHEEFIADCASQNAKDFPTDEAFFDRNVSRTISYAIHACSLEMILKRMYLDMISSLQKYVSSSIKADKIDVYDNEMTNIREFRNTVAAHTSYEDPVTKDDFLSEANSLRAFLSGSFDGKNIETYMINTVPVTSPNHITKRPLPHVGIKNLHQDMTNHFSRWEGIFLSKLKESRAFLPIKKADYHIN